MFMEMARVASRRSTCFRLNVGAVVTQDNNPVSVGWNGQEPGAPHCLGNECPGIVPGNCGTRHAETNALTKAEGILRPWPHTPVDLYCTNSPCPICIDRIIQSPLRVERVFFEIPYRNSPLELLQNESISVYEVTPAGYIVEYFSREVVELP